MSDSYCGESNYKQSSIVQNQETTAPILEINTFDKSQENSDGLYRKGINMFNN